MLGQGLYEQAHHELQSKFNIYSNLRSCQPIRLAKSKVKIFQKQLICNIKQERSMEIFGVCDLQSLNHNPSG